MSIAPFTLIVEFEGLCAFTPNEDPDANGQVSKVHVLLPKARGVDNFKTVQSYFDDPLHLRDHFPLLRFALENVEATPPLPDTFSGVWAFDDDVLEIKTSQSGQRVSFATTPADSEPVEEDFRWVPRIHEIYGVDRQLLQQLVYQTGETDRLSGVIRLEGGTLSSDLGPGDDLGKHVVYRFIPPKFRGKTQEQYVAEKVRWIVKDLTEPVVLSFQEFPKHDESSLRTQPRQVQLVPRGEVTPGAPLVLKIRVANLCCPDVLDPVLAVESESGRPEGEADFAWLYLLTGHSGAQRYAPVPVPVDYQFRFPRPGDDGGGQPRICTGCTTPAPDPQREDNSLSDAFLVKAQAAEVLESAKKKRVPR